MLNWLKWLVAPREMAELERWCVQCSSAERWLAEFPDAIAALSYVRSAAKHGGGDIGVAREKMRRRYRDALPEVRNYPPMPTIKPARDADGEVGGITEPFYMYGVTGEER